MMAGCGKVPSTAPQQKLRSVASPARLCDCALCIALFRLASLFCHFCPCVPSIKSSSSPV
ncbi:hypothetical protein M430DRAFT_155266 [Amorphotheca resinae ATCC 22711]|uniref:Uncharacterized protein n=1 Tax=Amorphotheca resinae ATCC 22711 TaxID=857342 RepID=A0A2T3BDP0_AMORE|nr:hypothetical protein M430DRAFT_155266 [Amorphotheca resinae ATCC 22711]PSS27530.1 hypothetical protein M430DRAFT_155266 [Amorphotheca resinae ATCC 22711]